MIFSNDKTVYKIKKIIWYTTVKCMQQLKIKITYKLAFLIFISLYIYFSDSKESIGGAIHSATSKQIP